MKAFQHPVRYLSETPDGLAVSWINKIGFFSFTITWCIQIFIYFRYIENCIHWKHRTKKGLLTFYLGGEKISTIFSAAPIINIGYLLTDHEPPI